MQHLLFSIHNSHSQVFTIICCLAKGKCLTVCDDYDSHSISDPDDCNSSSCQNDGVCVDDINGYTCTCIAGTTGIHCENSKWNNGFKISMQYTFIYFNHILYIIIEISKGESKSLHNIYSNIIFVTSDIIMYK